MREELFRIGPFVAHSYGAMIALGVFAAIFVAERRARKQGLNDTIIFSLALWCLFGGMLGANVTTMVTYSLICNFATALIAPMILHSYGNGTCTFAEIIGRVAPTLLAPFVVAQILRWIKPKAAEWVSAHSSLSFYLWLISLILVLGRTTAFIIDTEADIIIEIGLAIIALVLCITQFSIGRVLGRMLGDTVAGGQAVGQKNTILAVWMSLNFLNPIASIAPTAYIIWQNFVNSYQIYRHEKQQR